MLTINLFSPTFGDGISTAYQTSEYIRYERSQMKWDGLTIFTDGLINEPIVDQVESTHKVGWLREPNCLYPSVYENSIQNRHKFDFILTYYQPLIDAYPDNYRYCVYGGVWIDKSCWSVYRKTKNVSMLFGAKMATRGHQIRHEIYDALGDSFGIDYFGFHGTPTTYGPGTKLQVLMDYRYSIVVETCREEGLFSEILLDCFAVGTIPIFWGAPDIGAYFDASGILSFSNIAELRYILDSLSYNHYYNREYKRMLPYIGANHLAMRKYAVTEDWLYENYFKERKLEDWLGR